jgi:1-acyl-sn-glycerol-3-phosphate acyltransferase
MNYLTTENVYRSPGREISWFARKAPTWVFYKKVFDVVRRASKLSRKGAYTGEKWIQSSLNILHGLESVGVTFEIENLRAFKNLESPCVFVGNHMSILETFVLPCLIRPARRVTFVVKESLLAYPLFKHVMISRNPIVVGRTNPKEDLKSVLEGGKERLSRNISIVVFPQTTRSVYFDARKFNTLGVKLAKRENVPVIPIAIRTDAWGLGKWIKDFGKISPAKPVRFCFGDPLVVTSNGKEAHEFIVRFIKSKLTAWYA